MQEGPEQDRFRELLLSERSRILELREDLGTSWRVLQEPERELEENAQKDNLSRGIEDLDTVEKERIEAIDHALRKLETGSYGFCENCGDRIDDARLEAIPWARLCISCEGGLDRESFPSAETLGRDLSPDYRGMPCEDRAAGRTEDEKAAEDQTLLEGEREKEETYRSMDEGTPTLAADELIPEKPE